MDEDVAHHWATLQRLSKPGQPLGLGAPTATTNNPAWRADGEWTRGRRQLHDRLVKEAADRVPGVERDRQAVVLAGPPGAGKSTALRQILGADLDRYLVVNADDFKDDLLRVALADGSYESWIKPQAVRDLEARGERFYPRELASLVHDESSHLAGKARAEAVERGDNIVVDTVLSDPASATRLGETLEKAGYQVRVVDVEVPHELSQASIYRRWEHGYTDAREGTDPLGGRCVPSEYARSVFDDASRPSHPEAAAQNLAQTCPAVTRYQRFYSPTDQARRSPPLEADLTRQQPGSPLTPTPDTRQADTPARAGTALGAPTARGSGPGASEPTSAPRAPLDPALQAMMRRLEMTRGDSGTSTPGTVPPPARPPRRPGPRRGPGLGR